MPPSSKFPGRSQTQVRVPSSTVVRGNLFILALGTHGQERHPFNSTSLQLFGLGFLLPLPVFHNFTGSMTPHHTFYSVQEPEHASPLVPPSRPHSAPITHHESTTLKIRFSITYMTTLIIMSNGDIWSSLDRPSSRLLGCLLSWMYHLSSTLPLQTLNGLFRDAPVASHHHVIPVSHLGSEGAGQDDSRKGQDKTTMGYAVGLQPLWSLRLSTPLWSSSFSPDRPQWCRLGAEDTGIRRTIKVHIRDGPKRELLLWATSYRPSLQFHLFPKSSFGLDFRRLPIRTRPPLKAPLTALSESAPPNSLFAVLSLR